MIDRSRRGQLSLSSSVRMNATLLLLNLAYLGHNRIEAVEYVSQGTCSSAQQRQILSDVTDCEARDTLIDLREHMPNVSNAIQVIPDFASVKRCGGSCSLYSHRCVPTEVRTKKIDVMVILSQFPRTQTETQCGFVEVEEHVSCRCDCPVQASDCGSDKYYEPGSCRCLCRDQNARNQCIMSGKQWDPVNCMCLCPMASWRACSTGYHFDFFSTCQCVPTSTTASTPLIAAIFVLLTCMVVSIVGGYLMYKRQTGIFRPYRPSSSRRSTLGSKTFSEGYDHRDEEKLASVEEGE